jgi:hypothetical protein
MSRRATMKDVAAVAAALGEPLAVQRRGRGEYPKPGEAPLIFAKNSTDTRWFRALLDTATAVCFPKGRILFPLQGCALLYFGTQVDEFRRLCSAFGVVLKPRPIDSADNLSGQPRTDSPATRTDNTPPLGGVRPPSDPLREYVQ